MSNLFCELLRPFFLCKPLQSEVIREKNCSKHDQYHDTIKVINFTVFLSSPPDGGKNLWFLQFFFLCFIQLCLSALASVSFHPFKRGLLLASNTLMGKKFGS